MVLRPRLAASFGAARGSCRCPERGENRACWAAGATAAKVGSSPGWVGGPWSLEPGLAGLPSLRGGRWGALGTGCSSDGPGIPTPHGGGQVPACLCAPPVVSPPWLQPCPASRKGLWAPVPAMGLMGGPGFPADAGRGSAWAGCEVRVEAGLGRGQAPAHGSCPVLVWALWVLLGPWRGPQHIQVEVLGGRRTGAATGRGWGHAEPSPWAGRAAPSLACCPLGHPPVPPYKGLGLWDCLRAGTGGGGDTGLRSERQLLGAEPRPPGKGPGPLCAGCPPMAAVQALSTR